jgi:hypothetical protein
VKPYSFTQPITAMCVSFGGHLPAVVSSRWPNHSCVRLLIIIGFQFEMTIISPLGVTRLQVIAVCYVPIRH